MSTRTNNQSFLYVFTNIDFWGNFWKSCLLRRNLRKTSKFWNCGSTIYFSINLVISKIILFYSNKVWWKEKNSFTFKLISINTRWSNSIIVMTISPSPKKNSYSSCYFIFFFLYNYPIFISAPDEKLSLYTDILVLQITS